MLNLLDVPRRTGGLEKREGLPPPHFEFPAEQAA